MNLEKILSTTRATLAAGVLAATPALASEPVRMIGLSDDAHYHISSNHRSGDSCELLGTLKRGEEYALDFLAECGFDNASAHTRAEGAKVLFSIPEDNDVMFRDRFEAGTQGYDVTLDGAINYPTTNSIIGPVPLPCGEEHLAAIKSTPGWEHTYDEAPEGFMGTTDGLVAYTPSCDGPDNESVVVSIQKNGSTAGPVGIWYEIDTDPTSPPVLEGLDYEGDGSIDNPVENGSFASPLEAVCGTSEEFWIIGDAQEYSLTGAPDGMSLTDDHITYDIPPCAESTTESVVIAAHRDSQADEATLNINLTAPPGPEILGLNYTFNDDNNINNHVVGGTLEETVLALCGPITRELKIKGDANNYELINAPSGMSLEGDIISYTPPNTSQCDDEEGIPETTTIRGHTSEGGYTDVVMNTQALNPRIRSVTHYPATKTGGSQPPPQTYHDTVGDNAIDQVIGLSCDILESHEIHLHPTPTQEEISKYTPSLNIAYEGGNQPSWMSVNPNTGVISAGPSCSSIGNFYFPNYRVGQGGKSSPWTGVAVQVTDD